MKNKKDVKKTVPVSGTLTIERTTTMVPQISSRVVSYCCEKMRKEREKPYDSYSGSTINYYDGRFTINGERLLFCPFCGGRL